MVNKVFLLGRLTADPEVKATPKGTYVANMRVATNTYAGKDEDGNRAEHAEFHNLVAFGKTAEFCGQYLHKGGMVHAEGHLHHSSWEDAAGLKHYRTEVIAEEIRGLDRKPQEVAA